MTEGKAVLLIRAPVGERLRETRLDVLPAVADDGEKQIWIGDGDAGVVLLKIPLSSLEYLMNALTDARRLLQAPLPPEPEWYVKYPGTP